MSLTNRLRGNSHGEDGKKAADLIDALRKELEHQKSQNNFDATRLMRLCNFCGVSIPESQEEQLQVAGVLIGSCLRELELKFSKLSKELEQVRTREAEIIAQAKAEQREIDASMFEGQHTDSCPSTNISKAIRSNKG